MSHHRKLNVDDSRGCVGGDRISKLHIQIAGEIGSQRSQGDAYCGLGIAYRKARQFDRAIATYENALEVFQELQVPANEARALVELVRAYLEGNRSSIETLQNYLQRAEKIGMDLSLPLLAEVRQLQAELKD
ncbi:MAG: tetratricopeptide repeat protein [Cyanobacteriota bacterium]|nr:tetratricopeptide repeat protein [Cyanobacteriota bacterium]